MIELTEASRWREGRRRSAREAIVKAAWELVAEQGLAGLALRDLARRAGITTPTVYAYFRSKNEIYDAMFGQAAAQFADTMAVPYDCEDPRELLVAQARRFFEFCASDLPRYQLLFQRTIPGFEPSSQSYAPAVRAVAGARDVLARNGIAGQREADLWIALVTGLASQQIANDPGGERWTRLVSESAAMFLGHFRPPVPPDPGPAQPTGARNDHDDS